MNIIGGGRNITEDYNTIFMHEDDDARVNKLEMWMAKQIGEVMVAKYPQRQWNVNIDVPGRMMIIMCPSLSELKGYHIHMGQDNIQELTEKAVNAGGEILERYGIKRGRKFDSAELEELERVGPYEEAITSDSDGVDPLIRRHK